jgi:hypothetical protein
MGRIRVTAALLAVVALGAAACSSGSSPTPSANQNQPPAITGNTSGGGSANSSSGSTSGSVTPLRAYQLVSAASAKTQAMKTAKLSMTMRISGVSGLSYNSLTMKAAGEMDTVNKAAAIVLHMPTPQGNFTMREIVQGLSLYMQLPAKIMSKVPGNKPWLKLDLGVLAQQTGINMSALTGSPTTTTDPTQQLNYLLGVSRNVKDLGTDTVRGEPTHRFHVVIDLQKALSKLQGSTKCDFAATTKMLGNTSKIPADVWLDQQGRLRRMAFSMHVAPGQQTSFSMKMVMDLYGFGEPVHIQAPPDSDVFDLTQKIASNIPNVCGGTAA